MNYALLNGIILLAIALVGYLVIRRSLLGKDGERILTPFWYSIAIVLLLTAVFDTLIIAAGIVAYDTTKILEVYIGRAPVEDFAYAIVSVILVVVIWEYYEHKG